MRLRPQKINSQDQVETQIQKSSLMNSGTVCGKYTEPTAMYIKNTLISHHTQSPFFFSMMVQLRRTGPADAVVSARIWLIDFARCIKKLRKRTPFFIITFYMYKSISCKRTSFHVEIDNRCSFWRKA